MKNADLEAYETLTEFSNNFQEIRLIITGKKQIIKISNRTPTIVGVCFFNKIT